MCSNTIIKNVKWHVMKREEVEAEQSLWLMDGSNKHRTGINYLVLVPWRRLISTNLHQLTELTYLTYDTYVTEVVLLLYSNQTANVRSLFYHYDQRSPAMYLLSTKIESILCRIYSKVSPKRVTDNCWLLLAILGWINSWAQLALEPAAR